MLHLFDHQYLFLKCITKFLHWNYHEVFLWFCGCRLYSDGLELGSDLWLPAVVLWNSAPHVSTMLRSNLDLSDSVLDILHLCNLFFFFLNKQSGSRRTLNVFLPTRADLCNLIFFFNKQSGSRRTLRAFLYFICFTFNVIRQGPLNTKHRSLHAIS